MTRSSATAIKPVYALVGGDTFLQMEEVHRLTDLLGEDVQQVDFDGERAELADVLDELRSFAMFGGGSKIVTVRNGDDFVSRFREQLESYLEAPSESATLILRVNSLPKNQRIYKSIAKVGQVIECAPPSERQLPSWIVNRGRSQHGIALSTDAAAQLAELVGGDLGRLDNELAKLAITHDSKRPIDVKAISGSTAFQREQEMWELTNELAMGRPTEALRRWRQLVQLDPSTEFRAVTWLTMWLEEVGVILAGGNVGKMTWKYKDRLPRFIQTAKALGKNRHARALDLLAELDRRTKSGLGDATTNVERFILSLTE